MVGLTPQQVGRGKVEISGYQRSPKRGGCMPTASSLEAGSLQHHFPLVFSSRPPLSHSSLYLPFSSLSLSSAQTNDLLLLLLLLNIRRRSKDDATTKLLRSKPKISAQNMDSARPSSRHGGLKGSVAKLLHLRRVAAAKRECKEEGDTVYKMKLSGFFDGSSIFAKPDENDKADKHGDQKAAMEALLAVVFACISAIKASYAQLQLAQSPYDPESIQTADVAIVAELQYLSQLKHLHFANSLGGYSTFFPHESQMLAEIQEQRNLVKTFQITVKKLECELQCKDGEIQSLKQQQQEATKFNKSLSCNFRTLDCIQLSQLNSTYFLLALQYATKSLRTFAKHLEREMEWANWDLYKAAEAITPDVARIKKHHLTLAFESFISRVFFDGFQQPPFYVLHKERGEFFQYFLELNNTPLKELLQQQPKSPFGYFCRAKYEALVHPTMEEAFFGNLEQRHLLSSGNGYPETPFFFRFAEMARRVWVLHHLFFSFEERDVFVAARGCRFSDAYMLSATAEDDGEALPTVGFTVVPGFKVGGTVVQCMVYLQRRGRTGGRQR